MSTWISEISASRARLARVVLVAAVLPLGGCFDPDGGALGFLASGNEKQDQAQDVPRKASLFDGAVVVRGPSGYCIDRRSLRARPDGGFVLLASCEALSGLRGQAVEPVLMTVSVMPAAPGATRPGAEDIARLMAPAVVLSSEETTDFALVHFASGGDGVLPGGDGRHWRAGMVVNGHLVGLALYARKGSAMAGREGRALLSDLARGIRRSSARPAATVAATTGVSRPVAESDGLFPESE